MGKSKIEWTDATWNPVTGCTPISPGCANCYAKRMSKRLAGRGGYPADDPFRVTLHMDKQDEPLKWKKPRRVFVCSMGDLFHGDVKAVWLDLIFSAMKSCPQHTFILLTKRPENALAMSKDKILKNFFGMENVWLGVTAENQEQADKRIPILIQIPAVVRFVSVEPMLGPINLSRWFPWDGFRKNMPGWEPNPNYKPALHWVICGGETGPGARRMCPEWAMGLRSQCQAAGTPFFFKQWGEFSPFTGMRIGKKGLSRLLDGVEYSEYPEVSTWSEK